MRDRREVVRFLPLFPSPCSLSEARHAESFPASEHDEGTSRIYSNCPAPSSATFTDIFLLPGPMMGVSNGAGTPQSSRPGTLTECLSGP